MEKIKYIISLFKIKLFFYFKIIYSLKRLFPQKHNIYGYIYSPCYNLFSNLPNQNIEVYNKYGDRLKTFFLRDEISCQIYSNSKYFLWDRYNIGLNTHFYSHKCMLETMGKPNLKFGMLQESRAVLPNQYLFFEAYKELVADFKMIFTFDAKILDTLPNAQFMPFAAQYWNKTIDDTRYQNKTKNVSIVSSNKQMCTLHKFRYALAWLCKREALADTFGTFDGGKGCAIDDSLDEYRYSILIENDISPYFFTERLTSCFVAQTIPIYLGATSIGQFFNTDGMILINTKSDIPKVLKQCTSEDYESRLPYILDNYQRALKYKNINDYMYETYLHKFFES